MNVKRGNFEV